MGPPRRQRVLVGARYFSPRHPPLPAPRPQGAKADGIICAMSITIKDAQGIAGMREACRLASEVLDYIAPHIKPGITTASLLSEDGLHPSPAGYDRMADLVRNLIVQNYETVPPIVP